MHELYGAMTGPGPLGQKHIWISVPLPPGRCCPGQAKAISGRKQNKALPLLLLENQPQIKEAAPIPRDAAGGSSCQ